MKNRIFYLAAALALLTGCLKDEGLDPDCGAATEGTTISLSMTDRTTVETRSAASGNERLISDAYLLVFSSDTYAMGERVALGSITDNGQQRPKIRTMMPIPAGSTVVVLVNTGKDYTSESIPLTQSSTMDDINTAFSAFPLTSAALNQDDTDSGKGMPMSGKIASWPASAPAPTVQMYRSVAKIQLTLSSAMTGMYADNLTQETTVWTLTNVPSAGLVFGEPGQFTLPDPLTMFDGYLRWTPGWGRPVGYSGTNLKHKTLYIPEYSFSTMNGTKDDAVWDEGRMAMIVQGVNGRYYRVDFYDHTTGKYLDIKRNYHYVVNITKVNSAGYPKEVEAKNNPGGNLEYEIEVVGDEYLSTTSNGQYLVKTDKKAAAIEPGTTTAADLVKFACEITDDPQAGSSMPGSIATRKVRLVGADKNTLVETSKIQLCKSDGTACDENTFEFTASEEAGYQLKYTADVTANLPTEQLYLEIAYGSVLHYMPVTPFVLRIFYQSRDVTYIGGTDYLCNGIQSYKLTGNKPAPWTSEISLDGGRSWTTTLPAWITSITRNSDGDYNDDGVPDMDHCRATIARQTAKANQHEAALKKAAAVTNYNLASSTGAGAALENTANCYVVNAPGTYMLPLIYGNAIKNGAFNTEAYQPTSLSGLNTLSPFHDHSGTPITHPWISSKYTPADACLVWQDAPGLITNVTLISNLWLSFKVDRATIKQGNAIIAVRDASGTILWSWHIWVTDYRLGTELKTIDNGRGRQYTVTPQFLGWCHHDEYEGRSVLVRITQTESGFSRTFSLNQLAYTFGDNPYYQWGRKDPMLPLIPTVSSTTIAGGYSSDNKPCYTDSDKTGYAFTSRNMSITTPEYGRNGYPYTRFSDLIQQPYCMDAGYENRNSYMDFRYTNLWSANSGFTDENYSLPPQPVKTVYDPCPAGYCVPPTGIFYGFSLTGKATTNSGDYNIRSSSSCGIEFYCEPNKSGDTIFFPYTGYRNSATSTYKGLVGQFGYAWSANPSDMEAGYGMSYSHASPQTSLMPLRGMQRGMGAPVLPMKEQ